MKIIQFEEYRQKRELESMVDEMLVSEMKNQHDVWLTAQEAVEWGFADRIVTEL